MSNDYDGAANRRRDIAFKIEQQVENLNKALREAEAESFKVKIEVRYGKVASSPQETTRVYLDGVFFRGKSDF